MTTQVFKAAEEKMNKSIEVYKEDLGSIRAGRQTRHFWTELKLIITGL